MKISGGDHIKHTPGSDLAGGDVVTFANMIGIVETAIQAGALGSLAVAGLFELVRVPAVFSAIPAGSKIYWSIANQYADTSSVGAILIGHSVEVSGKFDQTIKVLLRQ